MTAHQREELRVQSKDYTFKMYNAFGSGVFAGQICDICNRQSFVPMKSAMRMLDIIWFNMNDSTSKRRIACTKQRLHL